MHSESEPKPLQESRNGVVVVRLTLPVGFRVDQARCKVVRRHALTLNSGPRQGFRHIPCPRCGLDEFCINIAFRESRLLRPTVTLTCSTLTVFQGLAFRECRVSYLKHSCDGDGGGGGGGGNDDYRDVLDAPGVRMMGAHLQILQRQRSMQMDLAFLGLSQEARSTRGRAFEDP